MMSLTTQAAWLFLLAIPVACIAWTVTHEEVFKEPREFCVKQSKERRSLFGRKFFYVTIFILILSEYKLLLDDWRGYLIAGFALVWIANLYMAIFALIKVDVNLERLQVKKEEKELNGK
jgi:hypothetical protein